MKGLMAALAAAAVSTSGCAVPGFSRGTSRSMTVSSAMPAAEGTARFGVASNDNTSIELTVKHLARPEKLTPPANAYVVWTRGSKDAAPQSIGALAVGKDLTGRLSTVSPLHGFELFVTAEPSGQAQAPSGDPLLWTSYSR